MYTIYGTREHRTAPIAAVHCSKTVPDLVDYLPLDKADTVKEARLFTAKWLIRLHLPCDLPEAELYSNPAKLRRYLGDEEITRDSKSANDSFWERHFKHPDILERLLESAQSKGTWDGIAGPINDIRYGTDLKTEYEGYKIPSSDSPFYSRLIQMIGPSLCGVYGLRTSRADDMQLPENFRPELPCRDWRSFAAAHADQVRWAPLIEESDEGDSFEY